MKTLLFTLEYPPFKGGVANYYGNLSKYWPEAGGLDVLDNSGNRLLGGLFWPKWLPALKIFFSAMNRSGYERVLIGQLLPLGTVALAYSLFRKLDYSVFVHGMEIPFAARNWRKRLISRLILKRARRIFCPSRFTAGLVKDFIGDDSKITVVYPGVEADFGKLSALGGHALDGEIGKKIGDLNSKIILFTISRLVRRKGHDKVISAMDRIAEDHPDIHYYIAGQGEDEGYLRDLAKNNQNVHFLGPISEDEKWAWLGAADIFIMPARNIKGDFEGFGIVYLEAALAGKPSIAGNAGGAAEAVVNGETGIIVDPESADEIAASILKLADDKDLRQRLGANGRTRAMNDFSWEKQVRKIHSIINNQ